MIKGVGIDLVENKRIEEIIKRWGERFLKKVFTPAEIEYCQNSSGKYQCFAARFAAKEAAVKMLAGSEGVNWQEIEVANHNNGQPYLLLHGVARKAAEGIGIKNLHITISHERKMTVAQVIGEGD